jgi:hypothetical protein
MPLSVGHREVALGFRAEQNTNGSLSSTGHGEYGNRYSFSYVDQFSDNRFGVALGYAHLDSPGQAKKYGAWAFGDYNGQWGGTASGVPLADGSGTCDTDFNTVQDCSVFQQGFESSVTSSKQARDGLMGVLEFRPNERFSSVVDLYYSKFEQDRVGHHWVGDIGLWSAPAADFSNVSTSEINGNNVISSATGGRRSQLRVRQELGPYRQDHLGRLAKRARFRQRMERHARPGLFVRRPQRGLHPVRRAGERKQFLRFREPRDSRRLVHLLVHPAEPDRPDGRAADQ